MMMVINAIPSATTPPISAALIDCDGSCGWGSSSSTDGKRNTELMHFSNAYTVVLAC